MSAVGVCAKVEMMAWRGSVIAHTLVLGTGIALASGTASATATDAECFGGAPELVVRDQPQAWELQVHGRTLLWTSRGRIRSLDLDAGAVATVGTGEMIRAVDDRHVFTISAHNQLLMLDRRTRKQRMLVNGRRTLELAIVSSSVGVHGGYAYFGRTAPNYRRAEDAGLFRVPIDGGRPAERLATEPDAETPFVVARGAVVWLDAEQDAIVIHRRPLGSRADTRRDERRPLGGRRSIKAAGAVSLMRLVGDELFFTAGNAIWSVALDRQEPARERVPNAWPHVANEPSLLLVHGSCAYFDVGRVIRRARMDTGASPETVITADRLEATSMATDGRHLYWASRDGHIMRSEPSAAARVVRPPLVAKPAAVQPNPEADAYQVIVGDDFGCALVFSDRIKGEGTWRCWRAGAAAASPPPGAAAGALARVESFAMPGLDGLSFALGAGRVCAMKPDGLRCAPANQVLDSRGQVLRASGDDTGGARGGRIVGQAITGKDNFASMFVGLAFTCTRANNGWRCTGDDSYGQLASGALADPPRSAAEGRRAIGGALGAWHGCASIEDGTTECWGRNDVGQLGHVSPDTCRGGRATVACTRSPRETAAPKHGWLTAADTFTCAIRDGLWCWGGSRDGVFGTAAECAPASRQAWPTPAGPIAAPRATCAREPIRVPGFTAADAGRRPTDEERSMRFAKVSRKRPFEQFSVGPRGVCGVAYDKVRCRGAIPTPVMPVGGADRLENVVVSSGDRPSACANANARRKVICWGAGYSPESEPARPVEIDFAEGTSGSAPVVDFPPPPAGEWPNECLVHRACRETPPPLPTCAARADTPGWADLRPRAGGLVGTRISVRGALGVGAAVRGCATRQCCQWTGGRAIVVGVTDVDADGLLSLDNLLCLGDESRLCCPVPAYGQQVRVEGKLAREGPSNYVLQSPQICQEPATR